MSTILGYSTASRVEKINSTILKKQVESKNPIVEGFLNYMIVK